MPTSPFIPGRKLWNATSISPFVILGGWGLVVGYPTTRAQLTEAPGPSPPAAESWQVTERGQDFAVYQRRLLALQDDGTVAWRILGRFRLLENGLHYHDAESGEWKESRDLIESFPDGAIARYGPLRAIFSHDLNAENVFDVEARLGSGCAAGQ